MRYHSNRFWITALGGLFLLCSATALFLSSRTAPGSTAVITMGGVEQARIDLSSVSENYILSYTGESGITNQVEVAPGKIRVQQADCPDQICVHQGWISTSASPIVCLPNRLVIQIESSADPGVDGVAG